MTFNEAVSFVAGRNGDAFRKARHFDHDYGDFQKPWSMWMRIRLDPDEFGDDALVFFESSYKDEVTQQWLGEWTEDNLSLVDLLAIDWFTEEP